MKINHIYQGNCKDILKGLDSNSVNCVVTSPPYWGLRDYGVTNQLGLEKTPEEYVQKLVEIFREVKRVLKKDGTVWLNLGDSYNSVNSSSHGLNFGQIKSKRNSTNSKDHTQNKGKIKGLKPKDLVGIPWRVAFALQADGWYLRQDIIWYKKNPMPESVTDRCTKSHEYIFLLSKSAKYYYDQDAIVEKSTWFEKDNRSKTGYTQSGVGIGIYGCDKQDVFNKNGMRNKRSVWTVNTKAFLEAHFAVFPGKLIEDCIKAGCPLGGIVLDTFIGSGTTAIVARKQDKNYIGIELNKEYVKMAQNRISKELGLFE